MVHSVRLVRDIRQPQSLKVRLFGLEESYTVFLETQFLQLRLGHKPNLIMLHESLQIVFLNLLEFCIFLDPTVR